MVTLHTIYSMDHVPGRDPLLHIPVGAYFLTNSLRSTVRKYIWRDFIE